MFSQTVEYALRAVVHLAQNPDKPCTTEQISKSTKVPQAYLAKVLQALLKGGITQSQRGIKGGIRLNHSPENLTIWQVVQVVAPIQRINTCPLELKAHGVNLCPLHRRMDDALASVEKAFRDTTLAEVIGPTGSGSVALCPFPNQTFVVEN